MSETLPKIVDKRHKILEPTEGLQEHGAMANVLNGRSSIQSCIKKKLPNTSFVKHKPITPKDRPHFGLESVVRSLLSRGPEAKAGHLWLLYIRLAHQLVIFCCRDGDGL